MNIKRIKRASAILNLDMSTVELLMRLSYTRKTEIDRKKIRIRAKTIALINHDRLVLWDKRGPL